MKRFTLFSILLSASVLSFCAAQHPALAQQIGVAQAQEISSEAAILKEATSLANQARYENREKLLRQIQLLREAKPADKNQRRAVVIQSLSQPDFGASNARAFDLSLQLIQLAIQPQSDDSAPTYDIGMLMRLKDASEKYPLAQSQKTALATMILRSLQDIKRLKGDGPPSEDADLNPPLPFTLPPNQIFISGMSPDAIADPTARAQYKAIIARRNRNIKRYNNYRQGQILEEIWGAQAEAYLRDFAATSAGATTLNDLLKDYDIDVESVARIKGAPQK